MTPSATTIRQTDHSLFAALKAAEFKRVKSSLDRVHLLHGKTLIKSDTPIEHVYFPQSGMVSLVQPLKDGTLVEVGIIGKEGMVGSAILLGVGRWSVEAMVQMPGTALRLPAKVLLDTARRNLRFRDSLLRFTQGLFVHISQSAACNARHRLEQRLARWLLLARDRASGDELPLSHEFLSIMLGIRRAGVSVAVAKFKARGLVVAGRGHITILDRSGLEEVSCECYRSVKAETRRLLN